MAGNSKMLNWRGSGGGGDGGGVGWGRRAAASGGWD